MRAAAWRALGWNALVGDLTAPNDLPPLPTVDTVLFSVGHDRASGRPPRLAAIDGLRYVLNALAGRYRRWIYVSSTSVYGQADGEWVDEASPTEPTHSGGQLCLEAERLVFERSVHAIDNPSPAVVLRLAGIYGPQRLLAKSAALRAGEPLAGRPDAWLNLIHVEDAVLSIDAVADAHLPRSCYLVADGTPVRRVDYYRELAHRLGAPPPAFDVSVPSRRGADGLNKRCNSACLRQDLPFVLRYPTFRHGLESALQASP